MDCKITNISNGTLDSPISDIENNIKIDSHQTSKLVKLRSIYLGTVNNAHGLGAQGGWYLDEGKTEMGINVSFADAAHSNLDLIESLGLYYRNYIIPYGTLFMNNGVDFTFMFIFNSPLDGKVHTNLGFNPYFGFGFVTAKL